MTKETTPKPSRDTVRNILDAATETFARVGFAGARVDEIARQAKVNKAAIYYHIGSKEALYARVLHENFTALFERMSQHIQDFQTPEEKLRLYVRQIWTALQERPQLASIMLREIAAGAHNLPEIIFQTMARMLEMLTAILQQGEQQGIFAPTVPLMIHFMIVGEFVLINTSKALLTQHQDALPEALMTTHQSPSETIVEHVETLVLRAVTR